MTTGVFDRLRRCARAAAAAGLLGTCIAASAQATGPWPARGELLYERHCGGCHSEQVHWRGKKLAVDWATLKAEVRRWQAEARLGWSEAEVVDVARFLNETIYRYPQSSDRLSRLDPRRALQP